MANKKSPTFIKKLISITELDDGIVQEEAARSDATFSGTLRKIIREWLAYKQQEEEPTK